MLRAIKTDFTIPHQICCEPALRGKMGAQELHFSLNAVLVSYLNSTRMCSNTQRDGCPAEYGWRPLFNAAKFG